MNEPNPSAPLNASTPSSQDPGVPPEPAKVNPPTKKKRRIPLWLKFIGVIVLLLGLLVVFAPTLASTRPARSFVLGKVNDNLNGRIEVGDWSLGWMSGFSARDLRVLDASGKPILQLASLTTGLSVLDAVRRNYALGDVVVDGLDFKYERDANGESNFSKLPKKAPAAPAPAPTPEPAPAPAPPAPAEPTPAAPTKLPDVSGHLIVKNSKGSYVDAANHQTVQFPSIDGDVRIPNINSLIENTLNVAASASDGQQGTLKISGAIDVAENNELRIDPKTVNQTVEINGFTAATLAAFMPPQSKGLDSGRLDGTIKLAAAPGAEAFLALTGQLDAINLSVKTEGKPITDEKLALTLNIRSSQDFKQIHVDDVRLAGNLVNARVFDTAIDSAAGEKLNAAPLAAVQKANATVEAPRLADLHAFIVAISPAEARGPDDPPAGKVLGGNAKATLTLARDGSAIVVTPDIAVRSLSIGAGAVTKDVGDIVIQSATRLTPADAAPADATFLARLQELSVPSLVVKGAGADIKLDQPLVIKDPAHALAALGDAGAKSAAVGNATSTLNAILTGQIKLPELLATLEAWQGAEPGTRYPYAGEVIFRQELKTSAGGAVSLVGRTEVNNFAMTSKDAGQFNEPHVGFANNLDFDPAAKSLKINDVSLAMETTNAVRMVMNGTIRELDTQRTFDKFGIDLGYDAKALWDLLKPIMDPETGGESLEEWTLLGKYTRRIDIAGSYPANNPDALKYLKVEGGFALEEFAGRGMTYQPDLIFGLSDGKLRFRHNRPAPAPTPGAPANQPLVPGDPFMAGVLSLEGVEIDLTGEHPRLNTPANHPLVRGASINPLFASSILGRFVNPAFDGATQARGLLDVTIMACNGLALDTMMQSPIPAESGRAELRWSLTDLFVGQPELVALVSKIKPNALNESGFSGSIRDGLVVIEGGKVQSAMAFNMDKVTLGFEGGIALIDNKLLGFNVTLPRSLFAAIDDTFAQHVPEQGYRLALTGTTDNWINSVSQSIVPMLADLGVKAGLGSVLDKALGGKKRDSNAAPGEPAAIPTKPEDILGGLLDSALGGDKETDAEKEARRQRIREERARKAAENPAPPTSDDPKLTKKERERLKKEEKKKEKQSQ